MGASSSSNQQNTETEFTRIRIEAERKAALEGASEKLSGEENDLETRVLHMIEKQDLLPCKMFAQEVICCIRGNHGEIANCIPPIKKYEQCVQDITYERIRKSDYNFDKLLTPAKLN